MFFYINKVCDVSKKECKIYIYIVYGWGCNMALDKILIGTRIRKLREEVFEESRDKFGKRCNLTERHIRTNRTRRFFSKFECT